jgi:hypothetical protein
VSSGLIAGESLIGILLAVMIILGIDAAGIGLRHARRASGGLPSS